MDENLAGSVGLLEALYPRVDIEISSCLPRVGQKSRCRCFVTNPRSIWNDWPNASGPQIGWEDRRAKSSVPRPLVLMSYLIAVPM